VQSNQNQPLITRLSYTVHPILPSLARSLPHTHEHTRFRFSRSLDTHEHARMRFFRCLLQAGVYTRCTYRLSERSGTGGREERRWGAGKEEEEQEQQRDTCRQGALGGGPLRRASGGSRGWCCIAAGRLSIWYVSSFNLVCILHRRGLPSSLSQTAYEFQ